MRVMPSSVGTTRRPALTWGEARTRGAGAKTTLKDYRVHLLHAVQVLQYLGSTRHRSAGLYKPWNMIKRSPQQLQPSLLDTAKITRGQHASDVLRNNTLDGGSCNYDGLPLLSSIGRCCSSVGHLLLCQLPDAPDRLPPSPYLNALSPLGAPHASHFGMLYI